MIMIKMNSEAKIAVILLYVKKKNAYYLSVNLFSTKC